MRFCNISHLLLFHYLAGYSDYSSHAIWKLHVMISGGMEAHCEFRGQALWRPAGPLTHLDTDAPADSVDNT